MRSSFPKSAHVQVDLILSGTVALILACVCQLMIKCNLSLHLFFFDGSIAVVNYLCVHCKFDSELDAVVRDD